MPAGKKLFGAKKATTDSADSSTQDLPHAERYFVGIDLGTTHSLMVACPQIEDESLDINSVELTPIDVLQTLAPSEVEARYNLPSFFYIPGVELPTDQFELPWDASPAHLVGSYARDLAIKTPGRAVHSAKSWLSHRGSNPRSANLPQTQLEDVDKVSAFEVTKAYLKHLQGNWDYAHPHAPLVRQDVTITVPASFDPAAREMTAEAAQAIGIDNLTLLEEPQAATYAWIHTHAANWREHLHKDDVILVVDVGGGTTDLSLIQVEEHEGELGLNRLAVGEHILLGGDNMDLALAYSVSQKMSADGTQLQPWQISGMTHSCREAKEKLFSDADLKQAQVIIPGRGSKLIGGTLQSELSREVLDELLLNGFFPECNADDKPQQSTRTGLTQLGLAYAQDAGITRHIAAFLSKHAKATTRSSGDHTFAQPSVILLNGGVFKAGRLGQRLLDQMNQWLTTANAPAARLLDGCDLDTAVAKGATYYGLVRSGKGLRIRGGLASSFYIGIASSMPAIPGMPQPVQALCVAPFGLEEGDSVDIPEQTFGLVVGEAVNFQFFGSTVRQDPCGTLLEHWQPDELYELPDIQAKVPVGALSQGEVLPVKLRASVTELGTLSVQAIPVDGGEAFKIELDVRENIQ